MDTHAARIALPQIQLRRRHTALHFYRDRRGRAKDHPWHSSTRVGGYDPALVLLYVAAQQSAALVSSRVLDCRDRMRPRTRRHRLIVHPTENQTSIFVKEYRVLHSVCGLDAMALHRGRLVWCPHVYVGVQWPSVDGAVRLGSRPHATGRSGEHSDRWTSQRGGVSRYRCRGMEEASAGSIRQRDRLRTYPG